MPQTCVACTSRASEMASSRRASPRLVFSGSPEEIARYAQAFNFGPNIGANRTVREVVEEILRNWPGSWEQAAQEKHLKEAPLLRLATDKAKEVLDWQPRWDFARTAAETVAWYREQYSDRPAMPAFTRKQIASYLETNP